MDLAKTLIRSVSRAFYETRHCLVVDALMIHSALPNEDLALLLGMQQKDLRKLCGKLREDRLITVHSRQETREGNQRPIHRDYYYIDFHLTIDAIKYRISMLEQKVKNLYKPSEEKKDYFCPRCKSEWTQMEVLDSVDIATLEFLCHRCQHTLERHETSAADRAGHARQSKLMGEIDPLLKLLRQIDQTDIPKNDFLTALSLQVPIKRDESINPSRQLHPVKPESTTVRGLKTEAAPIEVSLVSAASTDAERRESLRKQELQNQLPDWHLRSTVTGERTALAVKEEARLANNTFGAPNLKEEQDKKDGSEAVNAQVDEYFAMIAAERARDAEKRHSSSDEEEDDDEFEEVEIGGSGTGTPGGMTPSSQLSERFNGNGRANGSLKVESESGSSFPSAVATPVERGGTSPAKRVKLDPEMVEEKEEVDSDEDEEFEDAL